MSVVSKNPFELLGDDEDRSASPAPKAKTAAATPAPAKEQPKVVPGAAPKGGRGARYPSRGGPRNVYHEDRPAGDASAEGFDGERVAPPKKSHQGKDRHTKGPREDRTHTGPRARAPGAAGARGPKGQGRGPRGAAGAEPAQGEKKPENWGNEEGKAELSAENQGEKDGAEAAAAPEEVEEVEAEEEDTSKTLDQYLAEKAEAALGGVLAKKEVRQVSADNIEGKAFQREEEDSFFTGKTKATQTKEKAPKKEKVYIAVDGQFARPDRQDRPQRGERPQRGGARGRGAPRGGATRGAAPRKPAQAAINPQDESAFPSLA